MSLCCCSHGNSAIVWCWSVSWTKGLNSGLTAFYGPLSAASLTVGLQWDCQDLQHCFTAGFSYLCLEIISTSHTAPIYTRLPRCCQWLRRHRPPGWAREWGAAGWHHQGGAASEQGGPGDATQRPHREDQLPRGLDLRVGLLLLTLYSSQPGQRRKSLSILFSPENHSNFTALMWSIRSPKMI